MKVILIVVQIMLLYAIYLVGSYVQAWLNLPIPGSIIGLLLLFVLLLCRVIPVSWIEKGSTTILFYLPLFFIPATVGVMNHLDLFAGKGLLLVVVVIVSTILTIAVAGHVSQWLAGGPGARTAEKKVLSQGQPGASRNSVQYREKETRV
ncbi:CidA/LrgA family protein [Paenibacillus shenyangensis]|uniref:CidA/LrgA family protein n=1 Tax=Paenibacillus sp. A9 TaxID=1284352 RepID=UPI0003821E7E|nr:CidA/LrgA family holin-like protein [Paenibacillus sp. A9]